MTVRLRDAEIGFAGICLTCLKDGACQDWAEAMAEDASVPLPWLIDEIRAGNFNHESSMDQISEAWADVMDAVQGGYGDDD